MLQAEYLKVCPESDLVRPTKILVGISEDLLAQAFKKILECQHADVRLVKSRELLKAVAIFSPSLVILESPMPQLRAFMTHELVKNLGKNTRFLYLTTDISPKTAAAAFRMGISGYLLKQAGMDEVLLAVQKVRGKGRYLSSLISRLEVDVLLSKQVKHDGYGPLTSRQQEVLNLLSQGLTMREIARTLNLKFGTVAFHKYGLMEKLKLANTAALIKYGIVHDATQQLGTIS